MELKGPELLSLDAYLVFSSDGVKRVGSSAYLMPKNTSWLNSESVRPTKTVLELLLPLFEMVAIGTCAVSVPLVERALESDPEANSSPRDKTSIAIIEK